MLFLEQKKFPNSHVPLVKQPQNLRKPVMSQKWIGKIKNEDRLSREKLESIADTLRIDYDGKRWWIIKKGYRCSNKKR